MNKYFILFLSVLTIASYAQSDSSKAKKSKKAEHYLGLSAGLTSGFGLSYKIKHNRFAHQISALPFTFNNAKFLNYAYTFSYTFKESTLADCIGYVGVNRLYAREGKRFDYQEPYQGNLATAVGGGISFNFHLGRDFSVNAGGGIAKYVFEESDFFSNGIAPTFDLGLFYKL